MIEYCSEMLSNLDNKFLISPKAFKIGEAAETGMLYEAGAGPAPGLVSPSSTGAHEDMDYFTFLKSTSAITHAMYICAQIGMDYEVELLKKIRSAGIRAEQEMFRATGGVNTQRGLLFIGGVVSCAAGSCLRKNVGLNRSNISSECKIICGGIVEMELKNLSNEMKLSNGEKIYLKHGISGIRGEAQEGLPSVIYTGLPLYEEALKEGYPVNKALVHSLVGIMTVIEDTVVINRKGIEGLKLMRDNANKAMELGGMKTEEGEAFINEMDKLFISERISPGGAADLLAVTVMLHELENMNL